MTVCIALPAGPNSLHRSRLFLLSGALSSLSPSLSRRFPVYPSISRLLSIYQSIYLPSCLPLAPSFPPLSEGGKTGLAILDFSYYSNKRTRTRASMCNRDGAGVKKKEWKLFLDESRALPAVALVESRGGIPIFQEDRVDDETVVCRKTKEKRQARFRWTVTQAEAFSRGNVDAASLVSIPAEHNTFV